MKITKKELEKIIEEELEKITLDEALFGFIGKGVKNLKGNFKSSLGWNKEAGFIGDKEVPADQKKVVELAGKFLSQFQNQLINNKVFRSTPLFTKYMSLVKEAITTGPERAMIKDLQTNITAGKISVQDIIQSMQMMARDQELRGYISSLSSDAEKVLGIEA